MEEERIADLALKCFDGDPDKSIALLELLKLSIQPEVEMPKVQMKCTWEHSGQCWKDIPDSIRSCKKPCAFMEVGVE